MVLIILCAVAVLLLIVHLVFNYNEKARVFNKIPGPKRSFILGNALDIIVTPAELFGIGRKWAAQWKGIYSFWCFPFGLVNIYNPEDIEIMLSGSKFNDKSQIYSFLKPWLGDGLLLSADSCLTVTYAATVTYAEALALYVATPSANSRTTNKELIESEGIDIASKISKKWQHRRKILTPAFHFNILRMFSDILEENSKGMAEKLEDFNGKITIDVIPMLSEYTLNSICETAMGTRLDEEKTDAGRYYKNAIYELAPGRAQNKHVNAVHQFTRRVIKERKEVVEKNKINFKEYIDDDNSNEDTLVYGKRNRIAMLDLLISAEKDLMIDGNGIQEEVDTFMFEGHDTTASGLVYFLMLLANNKDIQDKVFEEVESILGDSKGAASMQDLNQMKYLECCIKESLRLYPPVPFISRTIREPVVLSGHLVPAGTECNIHIYDLHRREDLFPDAQEFKPERFLPENTVGRHPYSYIPFSAGPRNCIGQRFAMLEMKSAVSMLLRRFHLEPVTKPSDLQFISDLVLRNNAPVYVTFVNRSKTK